jgi:molybdopterin molybdotransferase
MLAVAEALARVLATARPVTERIEVPLMNALGLVLAADVVSTVDVPPADNSAMDGYALPRGWNPARKNPYRR